MPKLLGIDRARFNKNYIINGDMSIFQRGNIFPTFTSIANSTYSLDRWKYHKAGAMVHNVTQDSDVPTVTQVKAATGSGYAFKSSMRLNLTTPDTAIGASEFCAVIQYIEGYNYKYLAEKPLTLSFWVKATLVGTYCVAFRNTGLDRTFISEYTVNVTDTWEYKTINISASPSTGTWDYINGTGLQVIFTLAAGSDLFNTPNAWQSANDLATSSQVNGVNTGATNFRFTGVMLNEGPAAAPFSLFGDDIEGELSACQRYLFHTQTLSDASFQRFLSAGQATSTTQFSSNLMFPVTMRATPGYTQFGASGIVWSNAVGTETSATGVVLNSGASRTGASLGITVTSGLVAGNAVQHYLNGTAWVFEAEL